MMHFSRRSDEFFGDCHVARRLAPRNDFGFTLAELLVATTLLSLILSSVYFLFYSSMSSWRALEDDFDTYRDSRNAFTVMQRDIVNVHRPAAHLVEGEDNELTLFTMSEPMNVEAAQGRHLMRVRYRYNRTGGRLIREEALVTTTLPKQPQPGKELDRQRIKLRDEEEFVVASHVREFELRYEWMALPDQRPVDAPLPPLTPVTMEQLKSKWGLPHAIRITLLLADPEKPEESNRVELLVPLGPPTYYETESMLRRRLEETA